MAISHRHFRTLWLSDLHLGSRDCQAEQLLALLQDTPQFHGLSAKFALQLDGGEALAMRAHPHDLWLAAEDEQHLLLGLAGCPIDTPLARIEATQAVTLVRELLLLFLELATPEQSRMRQLLTQIPADELLQRLQARLDFTLQGYQPDDRLDRLSLGFSQQLSADLALRGAYSLRKGEDDKQQGVNLALTWNW